MAAELQVMQAVHAAAAVASHDGDEFRAIFRASKVLAVVAPDVWRLAWRLAWFGLVPARGMAAVGLLRCGDLERGLGPRQGRKGQVPYPPRCPLPP